jgi:hypothetical protein
MTFQNRDVPYQREITEFESAGSMRLSQDQADNLTFGSKFGTFEWMWIAAKMWHKLFVQFQWPLEWLTSSQLPRQRRENCFTSKSVKIDEILTKSGHNQRTPDETSEPQKIQNSKPNAILAISNGGSIGPKAVISSESVGCTKCLTFTRILAR